MIKEHDLENMPLLIKTDTSINFTPEKLEVEFLDTDEGIAGGIFISLNRKPVYFIHVCSGGFTDLPHDLPSEMEREFTITKLPGPRLTVQCNNELVLDLLLTDNICSYYGWENYWNRKVTKIRFNQDDTASDFYSGKEHPGKVIGSNRLELIYQ